MHHTQIKSAAAYETFLKFIEDRSQVKPCTDNNVYFSKCLKLSRPTVIAMMKRAVAEGELVQTFDKTQRKIFRVSKASPEVMAQRLATLLAGAFNGPVVTDRAFPAERLCAQLMCSPDQLQDYTQILLSSGKFQRGTFDLNGSSVHGWKRVGYVEPVQIPHREVVEGQGFSFKVKPLEKGSSRHMTQSVVDTEASVRDHYGSDAATKIVNFLKFKGGTSTATYAEVAAATGLNRTWVAETVKAMAEKGVVHKQKQGRQVTLSLEPIQAAATASPVVEAKPTPVQVAPVVYVAPALKENVTELELQPQTYPLLQAINAKGISVSHRALTNEVFWTIQGGMTVDQALVQTAHEYGVSI